MHVMDRSGSSFTRAQPKQSGVHACGILRISFMQTSPAFFITNKHVYPFQANTQQRIARRPPSLRTPSDGCADAEASLDWSYPADACRPPSAPCGVVHTFPGSACIFGGFWNAIFCRCHCEGNYSVVLSINTNEANTNLINLCSFLCDDFHKTFDAFALH